MNPEHLLKHFDWIAEAPDAIPRLRRFILDLAVRGKLVEQDSEDESAVEQLKNYETKRKEMDFLPLFSEDDTPPFKIPSTWEWAYLGRIASVEMGQSPPSEYYNQSGDGIPFYQGKADFGHRNPTPRFWCRQPTKIAKRNDILISIRAPVGPTNVASEDSCIGRGLAAIRPHPVINLELLLYWVKGFENKISAMGFGTTFIAINKKQLVSIPLPIPPLAEQHRIVAKVDELMALCDELEAAQTKREKRRDRLVAATLHGLKNGETSQEPGAHLSFEESARFYFNHLSRLTTHPEHIQQLRQTILDLAICGKLIHHIPTDDPVKSTIGRNIKAMDTQILTDKSVYKMDVPNGWKAVHLRDILSSIQTGPFGSSLHQQDYEEGGIPVINPASIQGEKIVPIAKMAVGPETVVRLASFKLRKGDVVMGRRGEMGRCAVVTDRETGWLCGTGSLILRFTEDISPWFVVKFMNAPRTRAKLSNTCVGTTMQNLNQSILRELPFLLPPLAQQHRIVAKVDELMAICDELEAGLEVTATTQRQFLEASLLESLK